MISFLLFVIYLLIGVALFVLIFELILWALATLLQIGVPAFVRKLVYFIVFLVVVADIVSYFFDGGQGFLYFPRR